MARYFGTDGIRGRAGVGKLSRESIDHVALALGHYLENGAKVMIGRDTRESGHWIEKALVDGLTACGVNVGLLGVIPTAATSLLTLQQGYDLGIMITASHNPFHDNGIKLFGPKGGKLDDEAQNKIEELIASELAEQEGENGDVSDKSSLASDYISVLEETTGQAKFGDLSIVLDCANGAASDTAPELLRRLGVKKLKVIGNTPDGENINKDCGSTHAEALCAAVITANADIGIAMDGDADRLILVDEKGEIIDGDQIMGSLALDWKDTGRLAKPALVATVMSNLGLERALEKAGLSLIRTSVGDRHVAAAMKKDGYNLGGEQSGHMLMPEFLPTGDGMLAAIQALLLLTKSNAPASKTLRIFDAVPQLLVNVRYDGISPLMRDDVKAAIETAKEEFGTGGRILIRASGTEPVIRVMAEGDDPEQVEAIAHKLADFIKVAAA